MTESDEEAGQRAAVVSTMGRAWYVAVPGITLVIGVALGVLVAGIGDDGTAAPADDETTSTAPTTPEPGTAVVVPDSCLEAADTLQQAIAAIEDGIGSVRRFEAERIIELLNTLEDLDAEARRQVATCRGSTITDAPLSPSEPSEPTDPTDPTEPTEPTPTTTR